jgi:hypothetical protein
VNYADPKIQGPTAEVMLRDPDGRLVRETVTIPWKSRIMQFESESVIEVRAQAPERKGSSLQCHVHTDEGLYGKGGAMTSPTGECHSGPDCSPGIDCNGQGFHPIAVTPDGRTGIPTPNIAQTVGRLAFVADGGERAPGKATERSTRGTD